MAEMDYINTAVRASPHRATIKVTIGLMLFSMQEKAGVVEPLTAIQITWQNLPHPTPLATVSCLITEVALVLVLR